MALLNISQHESGCISGLEAATASASITASDCGRGVASRGERPLQARLRAAHVTASLRLAAANRKQELELERGRETRAHHVDTLSLLHLHAHTRQQSTPLNMIAPGFPPADAAGRRPPKTAAPVDREIAGIREQSARPGLHPRDGADRQSKC